MTWIVVLIPAFPLLGFLLNTFVIRNERQAGVLASAMVVLSFVATLLSIAVLQSLHSTAEGAAEVKQHIDFVVWEWMTIGNFRVPFGFLFDQLSAVMALLVTGVGGLIHIFSIGYMHGDARPVRYFAYLNLFIVAMLFLVMGDNMLLLFLGWEGVGLCSFLLIGHWFDRKSVPPGIVPAEASVKAFVANRVGDAGMLLAMMALFASFGTLTFYNQSSGISGYLDNAEQLGFQVVNVGIFGAISLTTLITFLMLIGVTGKSAQIPLFVWLPDAMAGPTPVSALIHAATMVTSGVYLIARNHTLFTLSSGANGWVVGIGVLTALLAAAAAITQWDIKRVLAYSTVSQLGYMVAAVGMGAYVAGMFHLLTHGVFKALLFLGSASIIHGTHETQDMRRLGGLRAKMPTTFWTYMVGALALAGIFPLAGFWSKDEIIAHAFEIGNPLAGVVLILASLMTAFYMGRQVALIFWGKPRDTHAEHAHESTGSMKIVLIILGVGAVVAGALNLPGLHWLESYLHPVLGEEAAPYTIGKGVLAAVVTLLAMASMYGGWYLYARVLEGKIKSGKEDPGFYYAGDIWRGAELAWGFDWFYNRVIVRGYKLLGGFLASVFDQQGIDGILVDGVGRAFGGLANIVRRGQTGYIRNYAWVFIVGVVVLVGYFALV
ncbi:MAG: NADH-quinone oxidoreductase subunit L [Kouleothrix sp.]|jgi:NADH-quinone oxidoreductase subunit L|nr:NADH-quinone oxidoreductase subunit L [Kouleothrix sp.]